MDDLLLIWSYFSMKQHNHGLIFSLINSTCYCFVEGWMGNFTTILCLIVLKVAEVWSGLTFSGKSIWSWHFPGTLRHSSVWKKKGTKREKRFKFVPAVKALMMIVQAFSINFSGLSHCWLSSAKMRWSNSFSKSIITSLLMLESE